MVDFEQVNAGWVNSFRLSTIQNEAISKELLLPTSLFHLPFSPLGTGSLAKHEVHLPHRSQTHRPMTK